jgi:hypothetical protein
MRLIFLAGASVFWNSWRSDDVLNRKLATKIGAALVVVFFVAGFAAYAYEVWCEARVSSLPTEMPVSATPPLPTTTAPTLSTVDNPKCHMSYNLLLKTWYLDCPVAP